MVAESAEGREGYYLSNVIYGESSAKATTSGYQYPDAYFEDGTPCLLFVNLITAMLVLMKDAVFDASYIKFRELSVAYSLPKSI